MIPVNIHELCSLYRQVIMSYIAVTNGANCYVEGLMLITTTDGAFYIVASGFHSTLVVHNVEAAPVLLCTYPFLPGMSVCVDYWIALLSLYIEISFPI